MTTEEQERNAYQAGNIALADALARIIDLQHALGRATAHNVELRESMDHLKRILADALEALIGAIYLETGIEKTTAIVASLINDTLESAMAKGVALDGKTALQELTAAQGVGSPEYVVTESGPDHDKSFVAVAMVGGCAIAQGEGKSKREAEQFAARNAYEILSVTSES